MNPTASRYGASRPRAGSIRNRIAAGMLLSAALVAPVVILSLFYIGQLNGTVSRIVNNDLELIRLGDRVSLNLLQARNQQESFRQTGDSLDARAAQAALARIESACTLGRRLAPALAPRFDLIRRKVGDYRTAAATPDSPLDQIARATEREVATETDSIIAYALKHTLQSQGHARQLAAWGQRNIITVLIITIALLILLVFNLSGRLVLPVKRLANALNRAEAGQLDVRVNIETKDELGQLGNQVNRVFARLRELDDLKTSRIQSLEHRFHALSADIAEGVIVFDRMLAIQSANPAVEPLLGRSSDGIANLPLKDFPQLECLRDPLENALAGATSHQECEILPGLPFSAVCIEALTNKTGTVIGALVVITNPQAPEPPQPETPDTPA